MFIGAYILGSVPTAVWIGKTFFDKDVRDYGSGNAGSTNAFRVLGVKAGISVFIIDVLKGFLAVNIIYLADFSDQSPGVHITFGLILGIAALAGHIFPVFAGFKGGKGVATLMGVILAIHPYSALIAAAVFVITLLISRYVSLSSILAGIAFPLLIIFVFHVNTLSLVIFSLLVAVLLLFTHRDNIKRLIRNEENKANLFQGKKE